MHCIEERNEKENALLTWAQERRWNETIYRPHSPAATFLSVSQNNSDARQHQNNCPSKLISNVKYQEWRVRGRINKNNNKNNWSNLILVGILITINFIPLPSPSREYGDETDINGRDPG